MRNVSFIAQNNRVQIVRQGEYHVKISAGQQLCFPIVEPLFFGQCLAFGTMPVPAGVIRNTFKSAITALLDMAAEFSSSTNLYMPHYLELFVG